MCFFTPEVNPFRHPIRHHAEKWNPGLKPRGHRCIVTVSELQETECRKSQLIVQNDNGLATAAAPLCAQLSTCTSEPRSRRPGLLRAERKGAPRL